MVQPESESANEALVIQGISGSGQAIQTPQFESNETLNAILYAISHTIWCREPTMCGSKHTISHKMRAHDSVCHDIQCRWFDRHRSLGHRTSAKQEVLRITWTT